MGKEMVKKYFIAVMLIIAFCHGAQAAMLTAIKGFVVMNRGDGFIRVSGVAVVNQGDRVLVRGNGRARIDYGDGCFAEIRANQSAVVSSPENCKKIPFYSASTRSGGSLKDAPDVYVAESGADNQVHFVGGVIVVAGAAAIALQGNDSKPASP
jgi:hypothetical protein